MQRDVFGLIFGAVFFLLVPDFSTRAFQEETLRKRRPLLVLLFCLLGR
jgi:hypothetical protein